MRGQPHFPPKPPIQPPAHLHFCRQTQNQRSSRGVLLRQMLSPSSSWTVGETAQWAGSILTPTMGNVEDTATPLGSIAALWRKEGEQQMRRKKNGAKRIACRAKEKSAKKKQKRRKKNGKKKLTCRQVSMLQCLRAARTQSGSNSWWHSAPERSCERHLIFSWRKSAVCRLPSTCPTWQAHTAALPSLQKWTCWQPAPLRL